MKIRIWRGYHNPILLELIATTLSANDLLILTPPSLADPGFLDFLPPGEVEFVGAWPEDLHKIFGAHAAARKVFDHYPQAPHFGVFSSGTVSLVPRLILFRREQVEASLDAILDLFAAVAVEQIFCYPQPFHIFGFTLGYVHAFLHKRELVPISGKYNERFHQQWRASASGGLLTLGAPVHFRDLLQASAEQPVTPTSTCIIGGAPVDPSLWRSVQSTLKVAEPSVGYGATEACPGLSHLPPGRCPEFSGEIGWWLDGVETSASANGFRFRGPNLCLAIIDTETEAKIVFPDWFEIADEIEEIPTARLVYRGRSDWKLNRGGEKYSLEAIERRLARATRATVVAVAIPDERLGERLGLVLVNPERSEQLRAGIRQTVADCFGWALTAHEIREVSVLPLTANGKVDRRRCGELLREI